MWREDTGGGGIEGVGYGEKTPRGGEGGGTLNDGVWREDT